MPRAMNVVPPRGGRIVLAVLPFLLIAIIYLIGSAERRAANPDDKLLPPVSEMAATTKRLAAEPDRRSGNTCCGSIPRRACGVSCWASAFPQGWASR